jgi:hypothetical protein
MNAFGLAAHRIAFILYILSLVTAAYAQSPPRDVRDAVVGTWTLVSLYEENESGEGVDRWGDDPQGYFTADGSGHFMFQLVGRNPIRLESPAQSRACARRAAYESIGYAGNYVIDEAQDVMALEVDGALVPEFDKSRRTASISIEGDRLHFRSGAEPSPTGAFHAHLVWKRAQ